jgi:hypothetical protein
LQKRICWRPVTGFNNPLTGIDGGRQGYKR